VKESDAKEIAMKLRVIPKIVMMAAILTILFPVSLLAAQNPDSAAVSRLMDQVRSHAALADNDAATLESYTRSKLSAQTHATQINQMREHVNNLINDANELKSMRDEASPWQQEAIDRIDQILPVMAAHLTAVIEHFNDNRVQIHMQPYRDYVVANQQMIGKAHQMISDLVEYGEARAKADTLERELELTAPSTTEGA
jgi:hypothetical protein